MATRRVDMHTAIPNACCKELTLRSFNCHGLKSSLAYIENLANESDIVFLCEHWLWSSEIDILSTGLLQDYYVSMKSSLNADRFTGGRPWGGIGFICNKQSGLNFTPIDCNSDRIHGIVVKTNQTIVASIYGVYMPFNNNTASQQEEYLVTLDKLTATIESTSENKPYIVLGDMNASLPVSSSLGANWYKNKPYTRNSLFLHDFLCDMEMIPCVSYTPDSPFTYYNGDKKSFIDFIFVNQYLEECVSEPSVLNNIESNNSDHCAVSCKVKFDIVDAPCVFNQIDYKKHSYVDWSNPEVQQTYLQCVKNGLQKLIPIDHRYVKHDHAQVLVDARSKEIAQVMHDAADFAGNMNNKQNSHPRGRKRHWWTSNCTLARNRSRLFHHIWKEMGRPATGQALECYKTARRAFRDACRRAVNSSINNHFRAINQAFETKRYGQFWNIIKRSRNRKQSYTDIGIDQLESFYEAKFEKCNNISAEIRDNEMFVNDKFEEMSNDVQDFVVTEHMVSNSIRKLSKNCASGSDGLKAEHYVHGICSNLTLQLSTLLTICFQHGVVPGCFNHGLLIPILKHGKNPTEAKSYRPITLSVILSKITERIIMDECTKHSDHPAAFGYVESRGPDMAICLVHDVAQYMNNRGSAVFGCSLDAEGAFDHLPHSVIFTKLWGKLTPGAWRLLHAWYRNMYVSVRWGSTAGRMIRVKRGTRQGGLTSAWIFNIFYDDLLKELCTNHDGITIDNTKYNVYAYADDLFLTSATITGLQRMIDICIRYVEKYGLTFNAEKTICGVIGKLHLCNMPSLYMNDIPLRVEKNFTYLGAQLGNGGNVDHVNTRISKARKSFYSLQSIGMHDTALHPKTNAHLYNTSIHPCLIYATHAIALTKSDVKVMETAQGNILKSAMGLPKFSRTSPLLKALGVQSISKTIDILSLKLMKRCLYSDSLTKTFYWNLLRKSEKSKTLVDRCNEIMNKENMTLQTVLFDKIQLCNNLQPCGIADSVRFLLDDYVCNKPMIKLLLSVIF